MRAITIGYHDVVDGQEAPGNAGARHSGRYKLSRANFRAHLDAVALRANPAVLSVIAGRRDWAHSRPVFLTFDDGALSSYTCVAEELETRGWRGHFFITTDWIGRKGFLDAAQIRELHARGHVIGSHSCSHPARMSKLGWHELLHEWKDSCAILGDILREPVRTASVADGYYSRKVGQAAAAAGIEVLFTSDPRTRVAHVEKCMVLGRYAIQSHTPAHISGAIAAGDCLSRWLQSVSWQARKPVKAVTGESYFAIRRFLLSRGAAAAR